MIPQVSAADALFVKVKRAMGGLGSFRGANNADGVRQEPAVSKWNINNVTVRLPSLDSNLNMAAFLSFSMTVCTYRWRLFQFGWFYSQDSTRRLRILYPEFAKNREEDIADAVKRLNVNTWRMRQVLETFRFWKDTDTSRFIEFPDRNDLMSLVQVNKNATTSVS